MNTIAIICLLAVLIPLACTIALAVMCARAPEAPEGME